MPEIPAGAESRALSVSRFINITDEVLQNLGTAFVIGEISEIYPRSHLYFKLKDENASVDCLMWASQLRQLPFKPEVGMQVIAEGNSSLYRKNGQFKLIVRNMVPAGRGRILEQLEELKRKLTTDGIFSRPKRPIPRFVDKVGVITSAEGRVLHDISTTINRRNPLIELKLYPAAVQGCEAASSLCAALRQAYADHDCDVLIIGRGGGSFEDLLPFSDEWLTRLVAQSPLPIISAVGHEPDTAFTDFAADLRAATPTAAAELVSFYTSAQLQEQCTVFCDRLNDLIGLHLDDRTDLLQKIKLRLQAAGPEHQLVLKQGTLENLSYKLQRLCENQLQYKKLQLQQLYGALLSCEPGAQLTADERLLQQLEQHLQRAIAKRLESAGSQLEKMQISLLSLPLEQSLKHQSLELENAAGRLLGLNPLAILRRGYSITLGEDEHALRAEKVKPGTKICTLIEGARLYSTVSAVEPFTPPTGVPAAQ